MYMYIVQSECQNYYVPPLGIGLLLADEIIPYGLHQHGAGSYGVRSYDTTYKTARMHMRKQAPPLRRRAPVHVPAYHAQRIHAE